MKDHDTCPRALLTIMQALVVECLRSHFVKMMAVAAATIQPDFRIQLALRRIH